MKLKRNVLKKELERGFTLIEILVAILVGATVLAIAIIALVATNSSSLRLLAKQEAQQNTRRAISLIFSELSNAESLPQCRIINPEVADARNKQLQISNPSLGYPQNPSTAVLFSNSADCLETSESGYVIAYAGSNRICFFETPEGDDRANTTARPNIKCITRGGPRETSGSITADVRGITSCVHQNLSGTESHILYTYECTGNGGNGLLIWPMNYSFDSSTLTVIADLGEPPTTAAVEPSFTTRQVGNLTQDMDIPSDGRDILGIRVNLTAWFDPKTPGEDSQRYTFNQLVLLRGSEQYREESANDF